MSIFKCKMCGADLNVKEGQKIITCEFCGSTQTVPTSDNDKKIAFYNRANSLRIKNEFDKAMFTYQSIIAEFPKESEAYWGVCLSKYGIEYVDDPYTGDKVPTCHRTLYDSILNDKDYLNALEYSDEVTKKLYEKEAIEIDKIQKRIIKLSQKEESYDIFISYKESDERGERTKDSVLGEDLYDKLTLEGYRVFFSKISLENKLGHEYEPIIFNALITAKVMLVIGSKIEYFNAPWVKNEWSRYLHFMEDDKTKHLIPCFFEMNAYEMPEEFLAFQAQDMSKIGAFQDIIKAIQRLIGERKKAEINSSNNNESYSSSNSSYYQFNLTPYYRRIENALKNGEFEKADWVLDEILAINPNDAKGYIYRILVDNKFKNIDELILSSFDLENDPNYLEALNNASNEYKEELKDILNRIKNKNNDLNYNKAKDFIKNKNYTEALKILSSLNGYLDSKILYEELFNKISKEEYEKANKFFLNKEYEKAYELYSSLSDYEDSLKKKEECFSLLNEERYNFAVSLFNQKKFGEAKELFLKLNDYKDSKEYLSNCVDYGDSKVYDQAIDYMNQKSYEKARELFIKISNTKDSQKKYFECSYEIAFDLYEVFRFESAIEEINKILSYPNSKFLYEEIYQKSDDLLKKCYEAKYIPAYNLGVVYFQQRRYEEGRIVFNYIPDFKDSKEYIKKCEDGMVLEIYVKVLKDIFDGYYDFARKKLEKILFFKDSKRIYSDNDYTFSLEKYLKGLYYLENKDYENAITLFKRSSYPLADEKLELAIKMKEEFKFDINVKKFNEPKRALDMWEVAEEIIDKLIIDNDEILKVNIDEEEEKYLNAIDLYNDGSITKAKKLFNELGNYKNSSSMLLDSIIKAEEVYIKAYNYYYNRDYKKAADTFYKVIDYKDSEKKFKDSTYLYGMDLYNSSKLGQAYDVFSKIPDYKDSKKKMEYCYDEKYGPTYNDAKRYFEEKKYYEAKSIFTVINEYKDSNEYIKKCDEFLK